MADVRQWSLVVAMLTVVVTAFIAAKGAPDPPPETREETLVRERMANWAVRDAKQWAHEHGDLQIDWAKAKGHLAIVIDDMGRELFVHDKLQSLRYALTFSVLPGSVYAAGAQLRLQQDRRRPREVLLHLPMEPIDAREMHRGANRTEAFLSAGDSPDVLRAKLERALALVPAATGVNNHMGSRLTADVAAMRVVMGVLRERGLYFLDSRTSPDTVAESVAGEMGVAALHRHMFIDHDPDRSAVQRALEISAQRSLSAPTVVIGHPSAVVAEVLTEWLPSLGARGIGIYPLAEFMNRRDTLSARGPLDTEPTPAHIDVKAHP